MIFYLKKCNEVKARKLKYRTNKANIIALSSMTSSQSLLHRSSQLTEGYRCVRFPSRLCIINENRLANFHELTHCTSFQIKETLKSIFFFFFCYVIYFYVFLFNSFTLQAFSSSYFFIMRMSFTLCFSNDLINYAFSLYLSMSF